MSDPNSSIDFRPGDSNNTLLRKILIASQAIADQGGGGGAASLEVEGGTGKKLSALALLTTPGVNSRLYITDPSAPLPADQSKALLWDDLRKALGGDPSSDNELYVSKSGDDTSGNGSLLAPFLTIQKAIDTINGFADASVSNTYAINVNSGTYTENVDLPAFVVLRGYSSGQKPTYVNGIVGVDTTKCPTNADTYIYVSEIFAKDIKFTGTVAGGNYLRVFLYSVTVENIFQLAMGGCYPILRAFNIDHLANSEYFYIGNNTNAELIQFSGRLNSNSSGSVIEAYSSAIRSMDVNGNVAVTVVGSYVGNCASLGTAALTFDVCSYPQGTLSHGSSVPIARTSGAVAVRYTATTPADWAGTAPVTVQEAIDRLAAANPGA